MLMTKPPPRQAEPSFVPSQYSFPQGSLPKGRRTSNGVSNSAQTSPFSGSSNLDLDSCVPSFASSPLPFLSQTYSFGEASQPQWDNWYNNALPREVQPEQAFQFKPSQWSSQPELMHADSSWGSSGQQLTPRTTSRYRAHRHRESSLSSLGSAGPSSPYSHNTSNPQIADDFTGLPNNDDAHYQLATTTSKQFQTDNFIPNYPNFPVDTQITHANLSQHNMASNRQVKREQRLPQDDSHGRPRPISVTSANSISSNTPVCDESDRRRIKCKQTEDGPHDLSDDFHSPPSLPAFDAIPKLDRTISDVYRDELFNPNFTVTSAPPSQPIMSPSTNELFTQRVNAANTQHLSAVHSPASASSNGSPFRQGSPLAPAPSHDFSSSSGPSAPEFFGSSSLQMKLKARRDAQAMQQQLAQDSADNNSTPRTISPRDALIEYHPADGEMPLFPQGQDAAVSFKVENMPVVPQAPQFNNSAAFPYAASQLPLMGTHQTYSFGSQNLQQQQHQAGSASLGTSSRLGSAESEQSQSSFASTSIQRPSGTAADGGTYTCTYHGCTLRFDTPALLQKHKREGHRNPHGLGAPRRSESVASPGMTSTLLNSQAGPHRCDRVNPNTGKPCNITFSRPYDLTRHEDTIHNARKQKVRCPICTDEKTFSRGDALTRHYRVCHPEVELQGKHKRRGINVQ